jgi:hypothetical protein
MVAKLIQRSRTARRSTSMTRVAPDRTSKATLRPSREEEAAKTSRTRNGLKLTVAASILVRRCRVSPSSGGTHLFLFLPSGRAPAEPSRVPPALGGGFQPLGVWGLEGRALVGGLE